MPVVTLKGGPGSGHHGHKGIPGKVGGSLPNIYNQVYDVDMRKIEQNIDDTQNDISNLCSINHDLGDPTQFYTNYFDDFKKYVFNSEIVIRQGEVQALDILNSGKILNQFDTHQSNGSLNEDLRIEVEETVFDLPEDTLPNRRPIYGYLENIESCANTGTALASYYGDIKFILNDSVRDRTSMTIGDSLNRYVEGDTTYPHAVNDPGLYSSKEIIEKYIPRYSSRNMTDIFHMALVSAGEYVEAQIWGGVSLKDIKRVVVEHPYIRDRATTMDSVLRYPVDTITVMRHLKLHNIPFTVVDDIYGEISSESIGWLKDD